MTAQKRLASVGILLVFGLLGLLLTSSGRGQGKEQSPSDLIRFLTYQSDRPDKYGLAKGIFSCGAAIAEGRENRRITDALVKLGLPAIPDIETALQSIDEQGQQSAFAFNSEWLLDAYARIQGPIAYVRLRKLLSNPRFAFLQLDLDRSIAISLGLTSYVSGSRAPELTKMCSPVLEPRDVLDQLILAWVTNDLQRLDATLGPSAKAALKSSGGMRAQRWNSKTSDGPAVGYRFEDPGWWSAPEEAPEIRLDGRNPVNPEIDTLFTNSSGGECGRHRVKFLATRSGERGILTTYLVDNSDLAELLRLIGSCASKGK